LSQNYLQSYRSALPTAQGNQIIKILTQGRDSGKIRSIEEFKKNLQELTSKILAERITPTLKLYMATAGTDTSPEQYNYMLDRIQDDLEAGFIEADNLDLILDAHHNLIQDVVLKSLRYAVNELESKLKFYEFIDKNEQGFDNALFNTFREAIQGITARSASVASLLFVDQKTHQPILTDEDCWIDTVGERLLLGPATNTLIQPKNAVWLSNSNSIRSELDVTFSNSSIQNILDGTQKTYWVVPILLSETKVSGVPMEVALEFGGSRTINYVDIEPASLYPITLLGIDYQDANNIRLSTDVEETILTGPIRVMFTRISANSLILRLKQRNYTEIQFVQRTGESNFHRAILGQSLDNIDVDSITEDLKEILTSDYILSDLLGLSTTVSQQSKYFEYTFGFDNIKPGYSSYDSRGIFVSAVKKIKDLGQVGLKIEEYRPYQLPGETGQYFEQYSYPVRSLSEDDKFYHSSVEYWLVCQHYSVDGLLISSDTVPVLPLNTNRIYHERLLLTANTSGILNADLGQLMFYTLGSGTDVIVYRNGTALTFNASDGWEFVTTGDVSGLTVETPASGKPMKRAIRIKSTVQPLDIYTVSYTPLLSNTYTIPSDTTNLYTVDLVGDHSARLTQDNSIIFESIRKGNTISYTELYLTIIMRRNSSIDHLSPVVEEYMLVTGSRSLSKLGGLNE
jgi:hypothetical protein